MGSGVGCDRFTSSAVLYTSSNVFAHYLYGTCLTKLPTSFQTYLTYAFGHIYFKTSTTTPRLQQVLYYNMQHNRENISWKNRRDVHRLPTVTCVPIIPYQDFPVHFRKPPVNILNVTNITGFSSKSIFDLVKEYTGTDGIYFVTFPLGKSQINMTHIIAFIFSFIFIFCTLLILSSSSGSMKKNILD